MPEDDTYTPCDACGAHSYVFASNGVQELAYCGHHGTEYLERLKMLYPVIEDKRYLLTQHASRDDAE